MLFLDGRVFSKQTDIRDVATSLQLFILHLWSQSIIIQINLFQHIQTAKHFLRDR